MILTTLFLGLVSAALPLAAFLGFSAFFFYTSISFSRLEVEFRDRTDDDKLRHASYKGLREVQEDAAVYEVEE